MAKRSNRVVEKLDDVLKSWGIVLSKAAQKFETKKITIYLKIDENERLTVGELTQEDDEFVFRYSSEFRERAETQTLSGFSDRDEEYRSRYLWPFFQSRMPSLKRPEIKRVIDRENIDETDVFGILGKLSSRAVASPYEFELVG